ncbi:MAG TPA: TIGR01458 family HAD-type hydrolase [Candidatus Competibacteraceae bacterium]|nr:MAG: TIGR01458 family HAD-type hydrolase [Candidatus Competibacteraceae bacterium]HOB63272.1 TIGR01458 family HAD-type hydrolase [Candidatus Competibacteraceae bacterium]HQA25096.1 TIGR01458 family HAD-type hydrolase [Candidatus Competibacteraceae bacterium]HQD57751.1 TIGR01458 family HAD-type hydrolase [Candidatus Competibacteraceae bacterium]
MIHGVLLDLEGVLYVGGYPLPGAREALLSLRAASIPIRFITNSTRLTRGAIVNRLARMGLEVPLQHLFTPAVAARHYLITRKLTPHLLVHPDIQSEFADLLGPAPGAVLLGDAGPAFTYEALNQCFRLLLQGLPLLAMGSNRYFRGNAGLDLDIGPFMAALEYAADLEAVVLGKPAPEFFLAAVNSLNLPPHDVVMVGDDAEVDVRGAMAAGLRGVLVRTGKYRTGDEAKVEPHGGRVFNDLDAVVDYIL